MTTKDKIEEILAKQINVIYLHVTDDSHKHAGHAEALKSGGGHFTVHIVSDDFEGKARIARHKMIYLALGDHMQTDIHALAIKAQTIQESK